MSFWKNPFKMLFSPKQKPRVSFDPQWVSQKQVNPPEITLELPERLGEEPHPVFNPVSLE